MVIFESRPDHIICYINITQQMPAARFLEEYCCQLSATRCQNQRERYPYRYTQIFYHRRTAPEGGVRIPLLSEKSGSQSTVSLLPGLIYSGCILSGTTDLLETAYCFGRNCVCTTSGFLGERFAASMDGLTKQV